MRWMMEKGDLDLVEPAGHRATHRDDVAEGGLQPRTMAGIRERTPLQAFATCHTGKEQRPRPRCPRYGPCQHLQGSHQCELLRHHHIGKVANEPGDADQGEAETTLRECHADRVGLAARGASSPRAGSSARASPPDTKQPPSRQRSARRDTTRPPAGQKRGCRRLLSHVWQRRRTTRPHTARHEYRRPVRAICSCGATRSAALVPTRAMAESTALEQKAGGTVPRRHRPQR